MTAVPAATFRANFTEFGSIIAYPNSVVTFWLAVADGMLSTTRWGRMRDVGMQLFAAHNLALEKQATTAAGKGGVPGIASGPVSSKTVGPASISYDSGSLDPNAGHWNTTTYGQRLYQMMMMFGAGPIQVGIGCAPWSFFNNAWPGPYVYPQVGS